MVVSGVCDLGNTVHEGIHKFCIFMFRYFLHILLGCVMVGGNFIVYSLRKIFIYTQGEGIVTGLVFVTVTLDIQPSLTPRGVQICMNCDPRK